MAQEKEYPRDTYLMNMVTNHDLNSWEGTEFDRLGNLTEAFAVLSYTLPGMPLIYTGQETGMNRAFEFFEKIRHRSGNRATNISPSIRSSTPSSIRSKRLPQERPVVNIHPYLSAKRI